MAQFTFLILYSQASLPSGFPSSLHQPVFPLQVCLSGSFCLSLPVSVSLKLSHKRNIKLSYSSPKRNIPCGKSEYNLLSWYSFFPPLKSVYFSLLNFVLCLETGLQIFWARGYWPFQLCFPFKSMAFGFTHNCSMLMQRRELFFPKKVYLRVTDAAWIGVMEGHRCLTPFYLYNQRTWFLEQLIWELTN